MGQFGCLRLSLEVIIRSYISQLSSNVKSWSSLLDISPQAKSLFTQDLARFHLNGVKHRKRIKTMSKEILPMFNEKKMPQKVINSNHATSKPLFMNNEEQGKWKIQKRWT